MVKVEGLLTLELILVEVCVRVYHYMVRLARLDSNILSR